MTEEKGPSGSTPEPDADQEIHYCYRCGSLLKHSREWCGTCGADQFYTCRSCGRVFNKALHRCPECGNRRRRSSHRSGISRVSTTPAAAEWFRHNRRTLFYVTAGVLGGILVGAIMKTLASHSGPPNDQGYGITSLMYWLDPFIRAGKTVYRAILGVSGAVLNWIVLLILNNFKTTVLAFLGGVAGFVLAMKDRNRRRRARKHRAHREGGEDAEDTRTEAE